MIKNLKSNKIISTTLIIMCILILFNPILYGQTCLNALSIWALNILPLLFPLFVITRIIISLSQPKKNFMEKIFSKLYNTPTGSFNIFFLSSLSGYPMGAKLIGNMYKAGQASAQDCEKMLSFCSVSGPMFMIGTVGTIMLKSYMAGLIIFIANILASLINGILYRKTKSKPKLETTNITYSKFDLSEIVYDSLISILMVGAYVVLSFLIIQILKEIHFIGVATNFICGVFNISAHHDIVSSTLCGIFEITNGISSISLIKTSLFAQTLISSTLIAFGGLSVFFQNLNFISTMKISIIKIFLQKLTQAILCFIITLFFCLMFL